MKKCYTMCIIHYFHPMLNCILLTLLSLFLSHERTIVLMKIGWFSASPCCSSLSAPFTLGIDTCIMVIVCKQLNNCLFMCGMSNIFSSVLCMNNTFYSMLLYFIVPNHNVQSKHFFFFYSIILND